MPALAAAPPNFVWLRNNPPSAFFGIPALICLIFMTQVWYEYASDPDFKVLLKKGLQGVLKKQAELLEKELIKFGIPLPKQPSDVAKGAEDKSILSDDNMFRILHVGIMGALWLHTLALKQCTTNDRVRKLFKDFLIDEVKILDQLVLMGKVKGWINVVPLYTPLQ